MSNKLYLIMYAEKTLYSSLTAYCMNFIIFLCHP